MTDKQLRDNVQAALEWEPSVDVADVGVTVDLGVVTLHGDIRSYLERAAAERVALGVYGVRAVANELNVRLLAEATPPNDSDIAIAAADALKWHSQIPPGRVTVTVSDGVITLKGELEWNYQRETAGRIVRNLRGVLAVVNVITVRPHVSTVDVQAKIEAALKRSAEIDARRIHVGAVDGKVILTGNVRSWAERQEAARAAWAAPGVKEVDDRIAIVP